MMIHRKLYRFLGLLFPISMLFAATGTAQIAGPPIVCPGSTTTYSYWSNPCDTSWQWTVDPQLGNIVAGQGTQDVTVNWLSPGVAVLLLMAGDSCSGNTHSEAYTVLVETVPVTSITGGVCAGSGNCFEAAGQQFCAPGLYNVTLTSWLGCDSVVEVQVFAIMPEVVDLGTFCQTAITVCNQTFSGPGSYQATCPNTQGCDSTNLFTLVDPSGLIADAGPDAIITCTTTSVVLDGSASSQGPGITYTWTTPSGNIGNALNIVADIPGIYCLTVADQNGCQAQDCVIVAEDIVVPVANVQGDTSISCDGTPVLIIGAGSSTGPNFTYNWTTADGNFLSGSNTLTPIVDQPGTYCLTITNILNGCTASDCVEVAGGVSLLVNGPGIVCDTAEYIYFANIFSSDPPFDFYVAANGGTPEVYSGVTAGLFTFSQNINQTTEFEYWATDSQGCTSDTVYLTTTLLSPEISFEIEENGCDPVVVSAEASFPVNPGWQLTWSWSDGSTSNQITTTSSGTYFVTLTANGQGLSCNVSDSVFVAVDYAGNCSYIEGNVLEDLAGNCINDTGDPALANWLVVAEGTETYYGTTDTGGHYFIPVAPGNYSVSVVPVNPFWEPCGNNMAIALPNADDVAVVDFLIKKLPGCPVMTVDISTPLLRRCFSDNFYHVDYCNEGVETATDAFVEINFDSFLQLLEASGPYTDLGNNLYRFNLGTVAPGECGSFWAQVYVSCDAVLGQTHCTEAHIYPDSTCTPTDPNWSGASLAVTSECADSVYFTITNIGTAPMSGPLEYVVIEDAVMYMQSASGPALGAGETFTVAVPANGATWNVVVEQEPLHPASLSPVLALEGCGTNPAGAFSLGFVNQFQLGDDPDFVDIDCTENIGSYDPNDKSAQPVGYGDQHYIKPGTELEYLIRFQNTGTDTAFNITIRDTLSEVLDMTTLRPGAASHTYQYEIYGQGILKVTFPDIQLPDSTTNEPGSHGFVQFKVRPRPAVPLGTQVHNSAAIYFDFNEPIVTNTVFHTIDEGFVVVGNIEYHRPGLAVHVFPNPLEDYAEIRIDGIESGKSLSFSLLDIGGTRVLGRTFEAPGLQVRTPDLPSGFYYFTVEMDGQLVATGKLIRR